MPTRGKNCLDNIILNSNLSNRVICSIFNFPYSDHNGLIMSVPKREVASLVTPFVVSQGKMEG